MLLGIELYSKQKIINNHSQNETGEIITNELLNTEVNLAWKLSLS